MAEQPENITVIGGGSWATALVKILTDYRKAAPAKVTWWHRSQEAVEHINTYNHNPKYLSSVEFDSEWVVVTSDVKEAINAGNIIVFAIPAAFLAQVVSKLDKAIFKDKIVVSAIKGIVPETHQIVGEYLNIVFDIPFEKIGVITGPCHAEEVAAEKLSYLTAASISEETAKVIASQISCRYIKTGLSDDIFGTEYSAVLKNIYAVASGICHGLGYGDNFQAVLISNGIQEIKRFIDKAHPIERDIMDSAYLGDLLVTAYSQFSRNRTFGNMLGKGYSVRSAQMEMNMVAEGYYATKSVHEINQDINADMPILDAVYSIIYEHKSARVIMEELTKKLS